MQRLYYFIIALPLLFFLVIVFFLWRGLEQDPHQIPSPLIDHPVPAFSVPSLLKPKQTLSQKDLQGHVILLNVFASWCVSCAAEHPVLMDIHQSKKVILVGLNYKDERAAALKWLKQKGNPYQFIIDDSQGNVGLNLGVYGTPETFVIDKSGVIRYKFLGPMSPETWRDDILPQIEKLQQ